MEDGFIEGKCRGCGRDLVLVMGRNPYHPAAILRPGDICDRLLPVFGIPGLPLGFEVPLEDFLPNYQEISWQN